ncbi:hypothetical protein [Planobispora longispora]|uniref:Uncharacterized protein n=1 Tax=Planobispora longispora TaxID=28887 RepID=A0A8J3RXH6_9ACTN|nr:hypothetical protein [Planobispora longispora]BFE81316.1 hypothetical protein GCM10020093_039170 [Planobispora longispora]GIH81294.1 hypothetical protein Plo01_77230 [Planobispora longispora]
MSDRDRSEPPRPGPLDVTEPPRPDPLDVTDVPFTGRTADFYQPGASPARLRDRADPPDTPPDLLLRLLDPPPVKARHIPLLDLLRPAYRALAEWEDDG